MIKLDLEEFCHECSNFSVKQIGPDTLYFADGAELYGDITLTCDHIHACRHVIEFYKNQLEN